MISIRNLTKRFDGVTILEHVNLEIEKGDSVVIIGGSGCGKSTLLRCVNRLIVPEEGEILIGAAVKGLFRLLSLRMRKGGEAA